MRDFRKFRNIPNKNVCEAMVCLTMVNRTCSGVDGTRSVIKGQVQVRPPLGYNKSPGMFSRVRGTTPILQLLSSSSVSVSTKDIIDMSGFQSRHLRVHKPCRWYHQSKREDDEPRCLMIHCVMRLDFVWRPQTKPKSDPLTVRQKQSH